MMVMMMMVEVTMADVRTCAEMFCSSVSLDVLVHGNSSSEVGGTFL
jgi:hypothetical protein